jgi:hypothetical protein
MVPRITTNSLGEYSRCSSPDLHSVPPERDSEVFFFFLVTLGGVRLSPLGTSPIVGLLYQPRIIDDDDYGAVGGMRVGRVNRSTRRKPAPVPHCPPQIPHDLTSEVLLLEPGWSV